jgi:hypothetical protein
MARDQEPVTAEEIDALHAEMAEQREALREQLAADLGGEPEDYSAERYFRDLGDDDRAGEAVTDGGD